MSSTLDLSQPAARRRWLRGLLAPLDEERWNELARELFAYQYARVPAFRQLCLAYEMPPAKMRSWKDIPAVPQQLFKRVQLYCGGLGKPGTVYETSGTTTGQPGRQYLFRPDIYRGVATEGAKIAGFLQKELELHFLTPAPGRAPHSSLSAMFGFWQSAMGQRPRCYVTGGNFDFPGLRAALTLAIHERRAVALAGTAFSFVHLADAWAELPPLRLPPDSRVMETGGFKGRSREVSKRELYSSIQQLLGVADDAIWNEYGMSELSSQAYASGVNGLHRTPPWARVLVCDPATGREVRFGRLGLVRWIDLANIDSVLAIQTLDLAERTTGGFRLIGRMARTEPRGCSLGAEDLAIAKEVAP
jgi:hypothetical protein